MKPQWYRFRKVLNCSGSRNRGQLYYELNCNEDLIQHRCSHLWQANNSLLVINVCKRIIEVLNKSPSVHPRMYHGALFLSQSSHVDKHCALQHMKDLLIPQCQIAIQTHHIWTILQQVFHSK